MSVVSTGHDRRDIYCDTPKCEERDDGIEGTWQEFLAEVRRRRWKIVKDGDDWLHFCEVCAAKQKDGKP